MDLQKVFLAYIAVISFITFAAFGIDKWKAASHRWRISEAALIGLCLIGGSVGGLLGMHIFHHKTRKPAFFIGVPAILILQAVLLVYCIRKGSLP